MSTIIRHCLTATLFSLLTTTVVLIITFVAFPLKNWNVLIEKELFDIPYILFILAIPLIFGAVIGIMTGLYWRQRMHRVSRYLNELIDGQKLTFDVEQDKELSEVKQDLIGLQKKIRKQTEHAQRLATERAHEREKSLQEVVVQERNRLARELHDSVSQQLFASSMMMSAVNETNQIEDESVKQQLQLIEKMIHQSQLEMRALLLHLRPAALKGKTLQAGVEELLIELMQQVPLEVKWKIESFTVDKGVEDHLFRILQEAVSNTLRHAKATVLEVILIERDETVILRVVDNGIGFEVEKKASRPGSYGLQNMQERALDIGGKFKVVSLPNKGTQLEVQIPNLKRTEGDEHD